MARITTLSPVALPMRAYGSFAGRSQAIVIESRPRRFHVKGGITTFVINVKS